MPSTQELIKSAVERFQADVPALASLKLVFELELRGRGDVQMFRVELPGPEISKSASTERGAPRPPMSVRTQPGHIEFTRIPPSSLARIRVRAFRPLFEIR